MKKQKNTITILMADDDPDDRLMTKEAFKEVRLTNNFHLVEDGEELMDYLYRRGKYTHLQNSPLPGLILLDLNMPKKDGREALNDIKSDPDLQHIPVVVLTTSKAEEDILKSYNLGANSFIRKPVSFDALIEIVKSVTHYWLEIVELPDNNLKD